MSLTHPHWYHHHSEFDFASLTFGLDFALSIGGLNLVLTPKLMATTTSTWHHHWQWPQKWVFFSFSFSFLILYVDNYHAFIHHHHNHNRSIMAATTAGDNDEGLGFETYASWAPGTVCYFFLLFINYICILIFIYRLQQQQLLPPPNDHNDHHPHHIPTSSSPATSSCCHATVITATLPITGEDDKDDNMHCSCHLVFSFYW